jgi:autoinducer 2-degrading protein
MIRIVKLTFNPEHRQDFLDLIVQYKDQIRSYPGCAGVDFLNNRLNQNIFFTYSHWEAPENLDAYRKSDLFNDVWSQVKVWFADKPEAWSVDSMEI